MACIAHGLQVTTACSLCHSTNAVAADQPRAEAEAISFY